MSTTHPLRVARCLRNLTIKRLAQEAGIGASTVWRAEQNYPINAESRQRLCLYFGQTAQVLGLIHNDQEILLTDPEGCMQQTYTDMNNEEHIVFNVSQQREHHSSYGEKLSEQLVGSWLTSSAIDLAEILDTGLNINEMLSALRIVLQSVQGIPHRIRHSTDPNGVLIGMPGMHVSMEERAYLDDMLHQSVNAAWSRFHTARPLEVFIVAQAQLSLLQHLHDLIPPEPRYKLYASLYDLIGATEFYRGAYDAAKKAYRKAHLAALEGADTWDMAQSLNWQAVAVSACGEYTEAISYIEAALRLAMSRSGEQFVRLRAHLLADWAYNASLLQDHFCVEEKLDASFRLLEHLGSNEEFDLARWYQMKGNCMLILKHYGIAIEHLEYSLTQLPAQWVARRILTLIPLAETYARKRERDASIATAQRIVDILPEAASSMLDRRFHEYQDVLLRAFPRDHYVQSFVANVKRE